MKKLLAITLIFLASSALAQQTVNNPSGFLVTSGTTQSQSLSGAPTGTILGVRNVNAATTAILVDSAGAGFSSAFYGRLARGTIASPTAVQSGDAITVLGSFGYGASAYSTSSRASVALVAAENWTNTAQGAYAGIFTTTNLSTTPVERIRVENDGGITVPPTVTGGSKGAGSLNATTLFKNNSAVAAASDNLGFFSSTTSAQLAGVISDETGTGALVFGTAPTFTTSITDPLVIGGAGTGSTLSLRSTSGVGATDQILFQVGNNGATLGGLVNTTGSWSIGATNVAPDSLLTIMANTGATVAPPATTYLHIVGADSATTPRLVMDGFGGASSVPVITARKASGTRASPTAVASGDQMFAFAPQGYDGSAYQNGPSINFFAAETWSGSVRGSYISVSTIATGATALGEAIRIHGSKGLSIGSTTDPGGTGGLYVEGANIIFAGLTTDATHTDRTVCQDTTSEALFFGSGAAGICLGTSSARFKQDIEDYRDGLSTILALQPKQFWFKKGHGDDGARQQFGLLAEDLVKIEPRFVGFDAKGKPNSVDWPNMIWALVNSTKELAQRVESLEKRKSR